MTVIKLIIVPFGETNHKTCAFYFLYSTFRKKLLRYRFFLIQGVSVEEVKCIVQHSVFEETDEGWLRLYFFCYKTLLHSTSWFSFSLFDIMLFSVHIINVNGGKGGTVLDNLSVNINIYMCVCVCVFFLSSGRNLRKHFVLFIFVTRVCRWLGSFFSFYQNSAF